MTSSSSLSLSLNAGGSATGNPRNKCALKPGHSLMDWIRLGNSGADLTGFKGRVVPVSGEELAKHNRRDDAWLAIRGKVFNVTRYMDFHPGGVEELMRGVGRDATKLFDEVHAWVNYEQLLSKCFIGPLQNVVKVDKNIFGSFKSKPISSERALPPLPLEIVPRFDWIQKRNELTLIFYTKRDCNPGLVIHYSNSKMLRLYIQMEHLMHRHDFTLHQEVQWPPKSIAINSETGKVELGLTKMEEELWTTYGTHTTKRQTTADIESEICDDQYKFEITTNESFNHDSYELWLRNSERIIVPPVGYHVTLTTHIRERKVSKEYTPVAAKYTTSKISENTLTSLKFLIKDYGTNGLMSTHIHQLPIGSKVQVSLPKASFKLKSLQQRRKVVLLAAGSGITPCLSLLEHMLKLTTKKMESIVLMYFNRTEDDIWCRDELSSIADANENFQFINILSNPSSQWAGETGHISMELISNLLKANPTEDKPFVAICGPSKFNEIAETLLKQLEYQKEDIHIF